MIGYFLTAQPFPLGFVDVFDGVHALLKFCDLSEAPLYVFFGLHGFLAWLLTGFDGGGGKVVDFLGVCAMDDGLIDWQ